MRFENFQAFLEVAETRSMSKASENLYTTPQNISRLVRGLEADLNCELFIRNKRNLVLTHEGEIAYEMVKKIIDDYEGLKDQIAFMQLKDAVHTEGLRILVSHAAYESMQNIFNQDIVKLRNETIEVMETNIEEIIVAADCPNTQIDYIFLAMQLKSFQQHYQRVEQNYDCFVLDSEKMYVYMNKNSDFARKKYITPRDLAMIPLMGFPLSYAMSGDTYNIFANDNDLVLNTVLLSTNKANWVAWLKSDRACILSSPSIIVDIAREMGNSMVKVSTKPEFQIELIMCKNKNSEDGGTINEIDQLLAEKYPKIQPISFDINNN